MNKSVFKNFSNRARIVLLSFLSILLITAAQLHAQIIVSELSPFSLGRWTIGSGNIARNQDICVALLPQGPYSVTASGDTVSGEFALLSGFDAIEFQLYFNDRPRLNGRQQLVPGEALTGLRGRRLKRRQPCNRLTANLSIFIPEANLTAAPSGRYASNIVLTVSPE